MRICASLMGGVEALLGSLVLLLFPLIQFSIAIDSVTQTQSLRDGQTLISPEGKFELGFFSPLNSTNRYVGLWYHNISEQTVVWVANREKPLTDSSGTLTITNSGDLVVLDGSRNTVWSANVTNSANISSVAELLDSGNLILREANSGSGDSRRFLWQSFNYPSNTFLPMMRIGLSLRTGTSQGLSSWKSPSDPSIGRFSTGINASNLPQVFIYDGPRRYWRSGPWNGRSFIGVPAMDSIYLNGFNLIIDNQAERIDISYAYFNVSFNSRFVLDVNGSLKQLRWGEEEKAWIVVWETGMTECDIYGECGAFGTCDPINLPICSCLRGYEPKSIEEWSKGNWSGGCVRRTKLECERNGGNSSSGEGRGDGFFRLEKMKLPDYADWLAAGKVEGCEDACLKNCSCVAYAYDSGIGCMFWSKDLIDMQVFSRGGQDLYIRLLKSEIGGGNRRRVKIIILIAIFVGIIILCLCGFLLWRWMAKRRGLEKIKQDRRQLLSDLGKSTAASEGFSGSNSLRDSIDQGKGTELPLFEFGILAIATNDFAHENKLGQGGFGPVYKGKLPEGREIAVKRLSRSSGQGLEEFKNEVVLISKLQHRNLVRLLGCCIEGEEKMLVYEFMENNSLDAFLFDPDKRAELDWSLRFKIVEGIARGLLYLHRDSRLRIIHRDLKASNILLGKEMNPKISDFGMARIFGGDQMEANTIRVVGTYGYMSPEYAMEGQFSEKSDVFSFGVLLLEIVSGMRNTGHYHHDRSLNLLGYAWRLWNEGTASSLVDYVLGDSTYSQKEALRCIHVGLLCVQEFPLDRPTMSSIVFMLGNENVALLTPKQPAFTQRRTPSETDSNRGSTGTVSINNISITVPDGGR